MAEDEWTASSLLLHGITPHDWKDNYIDGITMMSINNKHGYSDPKDMKKLHNECCRRISGYLCGCNFV